MTRKEADFIGGMNMCDEIDNGRVYETNSHCFSIHDWERLWKLNIGGEE